MPPFLFLDFFGGAMKIRFFMFFLFISFSSFASAAYKYSIGHKLYYNESNYESIVIYSENLKTKEEIASTLMSSYGYEFYKKSNSSNVYESRYNSSTKNYMHVRVVIEEEACAVSDDFKSCVPYDEGCEDVDAEHHIPVNGMEAACITKPDGSTCMADLFGSKNIGISPVDSDLSLLHITGKSCTPDATPNDNCYVGLFGEYNCEESTYISDTGGGSTGGGDTGGGSTGGGSTGGDSTGGGDTGGGDTGGGDTGGGSTGGGDEGDSGGDGDSGGVGGGDGGDSGGGDGDDSGGDGGSGGGGDDFGGTWSDVKNYFNGKFTGLNVSISGLESAINGLENGSGDGDFDGSYSCVAGSPNCLVDSGDDADSLGSDLTGQLNDSFSDVLIKESEIDDSIQGVVDGDSAIGDYDNSPILNPLIALIPSLSYRSCSAITLFAGAQMSGATVSGITIECKYIEIVRSWVGYGLYIATFIIILMTFFRTDEK